MKRTINKTTKRLFLRPFEVGDMTPEYVAALNDKEVVKFTEARHKTWDRESAKKFIEDSNVKGVRELIGIFLKEDGKHIGSIRLHFDGQEKRVALGIMLWDKSQWGKGYGTEALKAVNDYVLNDLGYHKIWAGYYPQNKGSAKMFAKAGYQVEGVFKDHFVLYGKFVDDIYVAKLKEEKKKEKGGIKIPSAGPSITYQEVQLAAEAAAYGWYEKRNMHIDQFVKEFSAYAGLKYCLPTSHCTAAIHLAILALGIGLGDEVIVPDITWVASASPIHYVGAIPVFVDIDGKDWCITPESFERAITKKTKAVVVVDLLGNMPSEMDKIVRIAKKHNIAVIEDAAEGIGAEHKGKKAGTFGDIGVFSFNATKLMISGQGGALVTNDKELYEKAKLFLHHGIDQEREGKYYWSYEIGFNYQWTNIQAALALGQLRRIDELLEKKRLIYKWYKKALIGISGIRLNPNRDGNTFWIVTAIVSPEYGLKKEEIMKKMKRYNIDVRPFFYPISSMPAYAQYCRGKDIKKINPVSYEISPYGICLPSAMSITEAEVRYVCKSLKKILN